MMNLPSIADISHSMLYTPNAKPKSWTRFLHRNFERNKIYLVTEPLSSATSRRTALLLTWKAAENAVGAGKDPANVLEDAVKEQRIRQVIKLTQSESYAFLQNPTQDTACIVVQRYYEDPLALILPRDILAALH